MQKARSQPRRGCARPSLLPLVGMWFQDLFHSPHRGAFHLSLTVLVHYRSHEESLALEGGPPSFTPDSSCSGVTQELHYAGPSSSRYRALTVSGAPFQGTSADFVHPASVGPTTPLPQGPRFGLGPVRSPLLGASRLISLPPGTEMFQFPGFALPYESDRHRCRPGFPIRPSRDHCVCAAPPGLSQLTTAFIASRVPRHPPHAFSRLITNSIDYSTRRHCVQCPP